MQLTDFALAILLSAPPTQTRQSVLSGCVVDGRGEPIAGARICATSSGPWRAEVSPPTIRVRGCETPGYEGTTGLDGRFELRVPTPTSDWVTVYAIPDDMHLMAGSDFGAGRHELPVFPGKNDLGTLVCGPAGALHGRVVDDEGKPIAGARVRTKPGLVKVFPITRTDEQGNFRLGHVPAKANLCAQATGHEHREDIRTTVAAGETSGPIEIVLRRSNRLVGTVTGRGGTPIEGVEVRTERWSARGRTDAAGNYTLYLEEDRAHTVVFDAPGYEVRRETYERGATRVDAVLTHAATCEVVVRDRVTKQPVLEFGFRTLDEVFWCDTGPIPIATHAGGRTTAPLRQPPERWQIVAPGYAPREGEMGPRTLVIDLVRSATLRGTITSNGVGVPDLPVQLAFDQVQEGYEYNTPFDWPFIQDETDLSILQGHLRHLTTDETGRFEFTGLAGGTWRLTAQHPGGRFVDLRQLRLPEAVARELGDLELTHGTRVHGRVTIDGEPAPWLTVEIGRPFGDGIHSTETDETGSFVFEGIHPANYELQVVIPGRRTGRDFIWVRGEESVRFDVDL